jgi:hypothetical protein
VHLGIAVDGQPHVGQLAVGVGTDGVQAGAVERDAQHVRRGLVEGEVRKRRVPVHADTVRCGP